MPFLLNVVTGWHDPDVDVGAAHRDWARSVIQQASNASTGRAYINFLSDSEEARSSYGDEAYERLVALKNEYDPTNLFRLNQNIEPQPAGS
jgi:FAD/FMN-containing dehydrogenase